MQNSHGFLSFGGEVGGLLREAHGVPVSRKKVLCAGSMSLGTAFQISATIILTRVLTHPGLILFCFGPKGQSKVDPYNYTYSTCPAQEECIEH